MKLRSIVVGLAAVAVLAACSKESKELVFSGVLEESTAKVELNTASGEQTWQENDELWVTCYGTNAQGGPFTVHRLEGDKAYFVKNNHSDATPHHDVFATQTSFMSVYPHSALLKANVPNGGGTSFALFNTNGRPFRVQLPSNQYANASGYDPRTLVMVSHAQKANESNEVNFFYHNCVSFLQFAIASSCTTQVAYVKVTADRATTPDANHGRLVGAAYCSCLYNGEADLTSSASVFDVDSAHVVTFRAKTGNLAAGTNYYVACWPTTYTNLTIAAYDANNQVVGRTLSASGAHAFARNGIYRVGEIGGE